jgi:hypothetical protein
VTKRARQDFLDALTAELRVGREGWREIRPRIRRYVLPDGAEFFDWHVIVRLIQRWARVEPPRRSALEKRLAP